jgi:hypothetical protein
MRTWFRRGQHGDGKIGAIIGLLVLIAIGYTIAKWLPVRTQKAEFGDYIERTARRMIVMEISEDQMTQDILGYAKKEGIPLTEEGLSVDNREREVVIKAHYTLDIKLIGGKHWLEVCDVQREIPKV